MAYVRCHDLTSQGGAELVRARMVENSANTDSTKGHLILFPEGTTSNGTSLLPFRRGAFVAGVPVQPVLIKYPFKRFNPAWDTISAIRHLMIALTQLNNNCEYWTLPVNI